MFLIEGEVYGVSGKIRNAGNVAEVTMQLPSSNPSVVEVVGNHGKTVEVMYTIGGSEIGTAYAEVYGYAGSVKTTGNVFKVKLIHRAEDPVPSTLLQCYLGETLELRVDPDHGQGDLFEEEDEEDEDEYEELDLGMQE
jgi:hypothetical protein